MTYVYNEALKEAEASLANAIRERDRWTVEIARLEQLVKSLAAMIERTGPRALDVATVDEVSIQDVVLACVGQSAVPVIAMDVRDKLKEIGYDLGRFKNPLAVIHGALKRLAEAGKVEDVGQGQFSRLPRLSEDASSGMLRIVRERRAREAKKK